MALKDESIMTFSEHKGKTMEEIPDSWLKWFYGENKVSYQFEAGRKLMRIEERELMEYIEDSFDEREL